MHGSCWCWRWWRWFRAVVTRTSWCLQKCGSYNICSSPMCPLIKFKADHSSRACIEPKMIIRPTFVFYGVVSPATSSSPSRPRSPRQSSKTCQTGAFVMSCRAGAWCPGWIQESYPCQELPKFLRKWKSISISSMTCRLKGHFQEKRWNTSTRCWIGALKKNGPWSTKLVQLTALRIATATAFMDMSMRKSNGMVWQFVFVVQNRLQLRSLKRQLSKNTRAPHLQSNGCNDRSIYVIGLQLHSLYVFNYRWEHKI